MNPDLFEDPCEYIQLFFEKNQENKQIMKLKIKYEEVLLKYPGNIEQNSKLVQSIKNIIWKYECKQNQILINQLENSQYNEKKAAATNGIFEEKEKIKKQNLEKFYFFQNSLKEKLFCEKQQTFQRSFSNFKKTLLKLCSVKNSEIQERWNFNMNEINSKQMYLQF